MLAGEKVMKVLGIVGSPHKDGLTNQLVNKALEGAKSVGAQTKIVHLVEYEIKQWSDQQKSGPVELNEMMGEVDAFVLGAPVYYLDINGLTKDFMDTVEVSDADGKPALGIAMAGGTGKGLTSALKSIYYFFFCKGLRGIDPLPVSRFSFDRALEEAYASGQKLAELSKERRPFKDLTERIVYHYGLKYMNYDIVDEILLLTEQLIEISKKSKALLEKAKSEYEEARRLINQGRKVEAVEHCKRLQHPILLMPLRGFTPQWCTADGTDLYAGIHAVNPDTQEGSR